MAIALGHLNLRTRMIWTQVCLCSQRSPINAYTLSLGRMLFCRELTCTLENLNFAICLRLTSKKTVATNAPIIHGLWGHALLHIRRGRFGTDACVTPPEYNLTVRTATEDPEDEDVPHEIPRTSKGSLGLHASNIRNSVCTTSMISLFKSTPELTIILLPDSEDQ